MPRTLKARPPATLLTLLVLGGFLLAFAGCGDSGGGGGDGSQPADAAPPSSSIFVEGTIRPKGELKANVEEIVRTVGGIDDLGGTIVTELEKSAREDGEPFDYETEVEPWLGERVGVFLDDFDGEEFKSFGVAIETTDPDAAQSFVDKQAEIDDDPIDDASYEGTEYKVDKADESVYGVVGELLVVTEQEKAFKDAVDASSGDSLADEAAYGDAIDDAAEGSLADVYVDVGLLIEQSGEAIDESALQALRSAGIEPKEATAVASVIPGSDRVEVEISSDLGDQEAPSSDPSELLSSLPASSFAAFAVTGFGGQLEEALDEIDKQGIPGQVPPRQLKKGLKQVGIDLEEITGSITGAGVFAEGQSESSLGGALVLTTEDRKQASETVGNIGSLLELGGVQGVRPVSGAAKGFSINTNELPRPLVVLSRGDRIAIGLGLPAADEALTGKTTLADTRAFKDAVAALADTPIGFFADGPRALRLAESLVPASDQAEFREAKKYLRNISSIALGSETDGSRVTAKLIVSLAK
jgi:Protein of unknown function (DUF3352)